MSSQGPVRHVSRWSVVPSLQRNQSGWVLRVRNFFHPYVAYWFADRTEALEVKALVENGLTLEEALRQLHARLDAEAGL